MEQLTKEQYTSLRNMRDKRIPIWIKAINGKNYFGTFFASAGDYARIKLCK